MSNKVYCLSKNCKHKLTCFNHTDNVKINFPGELRRHYDFEMECLDSVYSKYIDKDGKPLPIIFDGTIPDFLDKLSLGMIQVKNRDKDE